jgi:hypothetical protein
MKAGIQDTGFVDVPVLLAMILEDEGEIGRAEFTLKDLLNRSVTTKDLGRIREARIELADLYLKENRLAEYNAIKSELSDKTCPLCKSQSCVVRISYGFPNGHHANVHQGGCVSTSYSPQWWCNTDKVGF